MDLADRAEVLLAPIVGEAGYDLLVCEVTGGTNRRVLRLYVERQDGGAVGIGDCVAVNNLVTDLLDAEDIIAERYSLEVSSPGLERPLRRVEHFEAHRGLMVRVRTWEAIAGRRNWKATLSAVDGDVIELLDEAGAMHRIPIPAIERANLVYEPPNRGIKKGGSSRKKRGAGRRQ